MVRRSYVPDVGDLVWITFDPQAGHEQSGRRPALVLSPREYNGKSRLALLCPITQNAKGYPFEVSLPVGGSIAGVILADHIKNLDWKAGKLIFESKAPPNVVTELRERLRPLLGL